MVDCLFFPILSEHLFSENFPWMICFPKQVLNLLLTAEKTNRDFCFPSANAMSTQSPIYMWYCATIGISPRKRPSLSPFSRFWKKTGVRLSLFEDLLSKNTDILGGKQVPAMIPKTSPNSKANHQKRGGKGMLGVG